MLAKRFLKIKENPKFGVYDKPAASFAAGLFLEISRLKSAFFFAFALFAEKAKRAFYHFCLSGEIKNGQIDKKSLKNGGISEKPPNKMAIDLIRSFIYNYYGEV